MRLKNPDWDKLLPKMMKSIKDTIIDVVHYGKAHKVHPVNMDKLQAMKSKQIRRVDRLKAAKVLGRKSNPGAAWHRERAKRADINMNNTYDPKSKAFFRGLKIAHLDSVLESKKLGMNPRKKNNSFNFHRGFQFTGPNEYGIIKQAVEDVFVIDWFDKTGKFKCSTKANESELVSYLRKAAARH
jgi:hypothetical protein